jgi:hypothetical protein
MKGERCINSLGAVEPQSALLLLTYCAVPRLHLLLQLVPRGASPNFTARDGVDVDEDAAKNVSSGGYDRLEVQRRRMRRHRLSAPAGLARRFWGDASEMMGQQRRCAKKRRIVRLSWPFQLLFVG